MILCFARDFPTLHYFAHVAFIAFVFRPMSSFLFFERLYFFMCISASVISLFFNPFSDFLVNFFFVYSMAWGACSIPYIRLSIHDEILIKANVFFAISCLETRDEPNINHATLPDLPVRPHTLHTLHSIIVYKRQVLFSMCCIASKIVFE